MKKFSVLLTTILMSISLLAQTPQGINYQTVIRDGDGEILPDTELTLQMTIRSGAPDGEVVYQETHAATTNAFGLVNLVIGYGVPQSNAFADIDWGDGDKYLETAIDLDGGGSYTVLGVTQFLNVPYAIFSQKAAAVKDGTNPGEMLYWNGEEWVAIPPGEHDQTLRLCNGVPTWGACTYNLALLADPAGAGTLTGAGQYEAGEQINITAEASTGWEFVNWTDANGVVSQVPNFLYTMPAEDVTLTANFVEEQVGFNCGDPLIDPRNGQSYATVQIGDQCWMAENLNIGTRIDGGSNQTNNGTIEKYCFDNSEAKCDAYGGLYQWNEIMGYTTNAGVQGICPEGWHLPSDAELIQLVDYVENQGYPNNNDPNGAGNALKSCRQENSPLGGDCNTSDHPRWDSHGTHHGFDEFSFGSLPGGYYVNGNYLYLGVDGDLWSSTQHSSTQAWVRGMTYGNGTTYRYISNKVGGHSVRCLRDITAPPTTYSLSLEAYPADAGTVSGQGQYEAGEQVNITAEANPGWEFENWTDNNGIVSLAANFNYTMPAQDITLTVNFVEEQVGFTCGDPLIDTRDGQSYSTVQIGGQCWMAENLAYLPEVSPSSQGNNTDPYYYVYGYQGTSVTEAKATAHYQTYGVLYNWPASLDACPEGWHLPADAEWTTLTDYVSSQPEYLCNSNTSYIAKALAATTNWNSYSGTCAVGNNLAANNATGFSGLPGGYRTTSGDFYIIGNFGYWWSSTENSTTIAWYRNMNYYNANVIRLYNTKGYGFSARCLRD